MFPADRDVIIGYEHGDYIVMRLCGSFGFTCQERDKGREELPGCGGVVLLLFGSYEKCEPFDLKDFC